MMLFAPLLVIAMTLPRTVYLCYPGGIISPAPPAPAKAMSKAVLEVFGCAHSTSSSDTASRQQPCTIAVRQPQK
jgi:hypothetical protein